MRQAGDGLKVLQRSRSEAGAPRVPLRLLLLLRGISLLEASRHAGPAAPGSGRTVA